jgi:3-hydroxyacyl-[acyl-carrier-protein] dehydratase
MRFVLIDRLIELAPGVRAVAAKTFSPDDEVFSDHFPGNPIVPGTLLLEAMTQTAGWLTAATTGFRRGTQLALVSDARFRRPVRPGVELRLVATLESMRPSACEARVEAHADTQLAATARVVLHIFDLEGEGTAAFQAWARGTFVSLGGDRLL